MLQLDLLDDARAVNTAETIRDISDALEIRDNPVVIDRRLGYLRKLQRRIAVGSS
jgi:hypothetical protein